MRVLLTNDDGYFSKGIMAMAAALSSEHEVWVVAPDAERSGVGASLTYARPLTVCEKYYEGIDARVYAVDGMPVDCVKLGRHMMGEIDMVVSGINKGANLGTDVLCSGTASAALDAAINGIQAIAISNRSGSPRHFATSVHYCLQAIERVQKTPLPPHTMLNINTPDLPVDEVKGVKLTDLGLMDYNEDYVHFAAPRGHSCYHLNVNLRFDPEADTDIRWAHEGYVTMTPVHCYLTNRAYLETMRQSGQWEG